MNTSANNSIRIGMNSDLHYSALQKGQYSFALNASVENYSGNNLQIQNTDSNYLAINFPANYQVIGKKYIIELEKTLFFLVNSITGHSQIGYIINNTFRESTDDIDFGICADCVMPMNTEKTPLEQQSQIPYSTYVNLIDNTCLNLDINKPVDVEYRILNNALYVYFVDNKNPLRFIYFDINIDGTISLQDRFKVITGYDANNCDLPIYSSILDCNKILYNPDYQRPEIYDMEDIGGGQNKAGVYEILLAYADVLGNPLTSYFDKSAPYPLKTRDITIDTDYVTDRAITFKISNLDVTNVFSYYNIVVARTVNNFTTFYLVATLPVTVNQYTITGDSQIIKNLTEDDIFFKYPIFERAASITSANDYLFFARLKEYKKLNLQQVANRIKVYWQTIAMREEDLRKAHNVSKYRGYMRDETYALGILFEYEDDNDSTVFSLVGPSKEYFQSEYSINVDEIISNNDVITDTTCGNGLRNKRHQVYNTGQLIEEIGDITNDCDENKVWAYGDFAYSESTELYPNIPEIWGDLCGKPIRHFRFPDSAVTHIHDRNNLISSYTIPSVLFPIGIKIDHTSVNDALTWAVTNNIISQTDKDRIKGYRIVRGNRFGNKSIQAKGLLYDVWNYTKYSKTYYYPNFPYNDLRGNVFLAPDDSTYHAGNDSSPVYSTFAPTGRYTFHSPDVHFTNSNLGTDLKLETEEYGKTEGFFNLCEDQPKYKILSTAARTLCFAAGVAAAISTITKQCRTITKNKTYISALGVASGTAQIFSTDITTLRYNNLLSGIPEILPNEVSYQDCKGTAYQWLNPVMASEFAPQNPLESGIMIAIQILTGGISEALYFLTVMLREIDIFTKLIQSLIPEKNYFIQYNSVGNYNAYKPIANTGNKIRKLDNAKYLETNTQYLEEGSTSIIFNNLNRETSVYLKTSGTLLPSPTVQDTSKTSMDEQNLSYSQVNQTFNTDISSYYASVKNYVPNQYGSVYNINYLETNGSFISLTDIDINNKTFFGGDTFINKFALKRKHPFFIQTRFQQLNGADVSYSELGNAAYPNYYLDYGEGIMEKLATFDIGDILSQPGNFFQDLVGTDDTRLDAKQEKFFYQKGYVHLYNYGIPYFFVESDVNVDFRHAENNTDKDFYPRQKDLGFWLQEKNVPIKIDNAYIYNSTYSKQNKESVIQTIQPTSKFGDDRTVTFNNEVLYTQKAGSLNETDNWRLIPSDTFYKTDSVFGNIISVDGIEREKVLIRGENGLKIFNAYDIISTENGQSQISTGRIFDSRPQDFAVTDLGYIGTQSREILNTEFGHIFVDAKRGNIFNIAPGGQSIDELGKDGMKNWFKNNLPFSIKKDFPELTIDDLDNSYKGIGVSLSFDRRFNRLFITKLDYKLKDLTVQYSSTLNHFYKGNTVIELGDPIYFINKSWTVSYNFETKSWTSFHSFTPNYYIDYITFFQSGINGLTSSLWSHSISNKSYQVYYGQLYPYTIDIPSELTLLNNNVNSIEYLNDVIRYQNEYDYFFNSNITFNKAVIYTNTQNSGLLNLHVKNVDNLSSPYPKLAQNGVDVEISNAEDIWRLNSFFDVTTSKNNNLPLWLNNPNNVDKELNKKALNYYKYDTNHPLIRAKVCNIRLTNDLYSNYKFIFILNQLNQTTSIK